MSNNKMEVMDIEDSFLVKYLRKNRILRRFKKNMIFKMEKCIAFQEDAFFDSLYWAMTEEGEGYWAEIQEDFRSKYLKWKSDNNRA